MSADFGRSRPGRIHPTGGYLIGGAHEKGLKYAESGRTAISEYFRHLVAERRVKVETKGSRFRFLIKRRLPNLPWGVPDEIALLRARHFMELRHGRWFRSEIEFWHEMRGLCDSLVNQFKS